MATPVIRNVETALHEPLEGQAAAQGCAVEGEARTDPPPQRFGQAMRALFEPLDGLELPETLDAPILSPLDFSGQDWDSDA